MISTIVLSKNVQDMIGDCLDSFSWTDEIIVVDSGSTDDSLEIARQKGARIVRTHPSDFSSLRNLGAQKAIGKWLLYIDADERVSKELKKEIIQKTLSDTFSAYAIPRKNNLLGHDMKYGGWWPDYVMRLIKKDKLVRWRGHLHEQPEIKGNVSKLKNPLYHISHRSISSMIQKTNAWSEIEARLLYDSNHPKMNVIRFFTAAFREFWYRGILKLGFLDGSIGVIEIFYQIYSRIVTYSKLWELQLKEEK